MVKILNHLVKLIVWLTSERLLNIIFLFAALVMLRVMLSTGNLFDSYSFICFSNLIKRGNVQVILYK